MASLRSFRPRKNEVMAKRSSRFDRIQVGISEDETDQTKSSVCSDLINVGCYLAWAEFGESRESREFRESGELAWGFQRANVQTFQQFLANALLPFIKR